MRTSNQTALPTRLAVVFLCLACLLPSAIARNAQTGTQAAQDIPILQLNQPLTRDLKGGEAHTYRLLVEARRFARVVVEQRGVDVFMRALDGQKKRLAYTDDSFGRVGPQLLEFTTETAGDYFIEVQGRKDELGGKYEITFVESRSLTEADRTRITAARHVVAGNDLRVKATAESRHARGWFAKQEPKGTIVKIGMMHSDWQVDSVNGSIPKGRYKRGYVIYRKPGLSQCIVNSFSYEQNYMCGGKYNEMAVTSGMAYALRLQNCN